MAKNTDILAQKIQRMLIADEDKLRLVKEMQELSEEKIKQLSELIREHDQEAISILDKKAAEVEEVKTELQEALPGDRGAVTSDEEARDTIRQLKEIFADVNKLAQLLANSDDFLLGKIEEVMLAALEHDPKGSEDLHAFFQEVRLQKAAYVKEDEEEQKRLLTEAVISRKEQNDKLDVLIAKAEKMLGKKPAKK